MKQKLIAEGYRVVKVKNTWITNGPYKGVDTVIEKDGINFEMQYHTQESFDLKNGPLHELYEKRRLSSTTKAERHKLDAEMVKLSKTLKVPKNIENPQIVRYSEGETSVYSVEKGWTENESWYVRIFFGDFTDFEEISESEAFAYIDRMVVA